MADLDALWGGGCGDSVAPTDQAAQHNTNEGATAFSAGDSGDAHTCMIRSDGAVFCWGANTQGQLGNGSTTPSTQPKLAAALPSVTVLYPMSLDAGGNHTCVVDANGNAYCWGENFDGELGDGTNTSRAGVTNISTQRFATPAGTRVRATASGFKFVCALLVDGRVACAGANTAGQLGNGTNTSSSTPVIVRMTGANADLDGVVQLAAGDTHACALRHDGQVYCWGAGMGNGATVALNTARRIDADAPTNSLWRGIAAGSSFTCGIRADGTVACWGTNASGVLGSGASSAVPVNITLPDLGGATIDRVVALGAGVNHVCAIRRLSSGELRCWGANGSGQVGNNMMPTNATHPVIVGLPSSVPAGSLPGTPPSAPQALAVMGGFQHTCAFTRDGVFCWGSDGNGELGNGAVTTTTQAAPVPVPQTLYTDFLPGMGTTYINSTFHRGHVLDVGGDHVCAIVGAGSHVNVARTAPGVGGTTGRNDTTGVACWGRNDVGQLGSGDYVQQTRPRFIEPIQVVGSDIPADVIAVATGSLHTCALLASGRVWCWGDNTHHQLAIDSSVANQNVPRLISGLNSVMAISAGDFHTCALLADGRMQCWGEMANGRLGGPLSEGADGNLVFVRTCDVTCPNPTDLAVNYIAISAGGDHTCALRADGQVRCWGANDLGQSGTVPTPLNMFPTTVIGAHAVAASWGGLYGPPAPPLMGISSITAGSKHNCALSPGGRSFCWGLNNLYQVAADNNGANFMGAVPFYFFARDVSGRHLDGSGNIIPLTGISAGGDTTCAMRNDPGTPGTSSVRCVGRSESGQAGIMTGTGTGVVSPPQIVADHAAMITDFGTRVVTSTSTSCVLGWNGQIECWGSGANGQLGRGSIVASDALADRVADIP